MGKKRIVKKTKEELLAETEKIDKAAKRETVIKTSGKITEGRICISSSYNNILVSLTDKGGNVLTWVSAGNLGFKGSRKSTPFAASKVGRTLAERAWKMGIKKVDILIKGVGYGRESALRSLVGAETGLVVTSIKDITPIPHNGCRPPKPRRH